MYPALKPGDQLVVKSTDSCMPGDIVVFNNGTRLITHRYIGKTGEYLQFMGDRLTKPEEIAPSSVEGKVILILRNGKPILPPEKSRFAFFYRVTLTIYFRLKDLLRINKQNG